MFVVLSGKIAIGRGTVQGSRLVAMHGPGVFTGEASTLAGRGAAVTATAAEDCEVITVDEQALRALVISEAELSETIMRAYILRRAALLEDECGGVILIGSRHSSETLRLQEFLGRNGHPVAYFDLELHDDIEHLLTRFRITHDDIPVIITPRGEILKNPTNRVAADSVGLSPDGLDCQFPRKVDPVLECPLRLDRFGAGI